MQNQLRFLLPTVQVAIATALTIGNRLRPPSTTFDPTFLKPDWQFCCALNAPATLIWSAVMRLKGEWYWEHPLAGLIAETFVFIGLVGLLWYFVSVEVSGRGNSVLTSKMRFRNLADVLAMIFGVALSVMGFNIYRYGFGFITTYSTLVAAPYFLWALAILAFYGHDLWVSYTAAWDLHDRAS